MNRRDKQRMDERRRQTNGSKPAISNFSSSDASKSLMDSYFQSQQVIQSLSAKPGGSNELPTKSFKIPKKLPTKIVPINPPKSRNDIRGRDLDSPPSKRSNESRRNFERRDMRDELNRRELSKRRSDREEWPIRSRPLPDRIRDSPDLEDRSRRDDFFAIRDARRSRSIEVHEAEVFDDIGDIPIRCIRNDLYDPKRGRDSIVREDNFFPKRDARRSRSREEINMIVSQRASDLDDVGGKPRRRIRTRSRRRRGINPRRMSPPRRNSSPRQISRKDVSNGSPKPRPVKTQNDIKPITLVFFDLSDRNGKISPQNAELLLNKIQELICKEVLSDSKSYFKFMGHKHEDGLLSITCADKYSCNFVNRLVKEMGPLWPGADLECTPETYEYFFVWLVIPKGISHVSEFLDICKKTENRLSTEKWRRVDCEEHELGTTCCFEMDVESYELIKEKGNIIRFGDTDIKIVVKQNILYEA